MENITLWFSVMRLPPKKETAENKQKENKFA